MVEISKSDEHFDQINVWLGKDKTLGVYINQDIYKTIKKGQKKLLKVSMSYDGPIEAPIKKDQVVGKINVVYDQNLIGEYDLLAVKDVKRVNIFTRLMKSINYLIWGDV